MEKTFNALGLQLIKFSLPPGETLVLISNPDFWHSSLEHYGQLVELRISGLFASYHEAPLRFEIRKEGLRIWFESCLDIQFFLSSVHALLGLSKSTGKTSSRRRYNLQEISGSECVAYLGFSFNAFNLRVLIVILLLFYRFPIYQLVSLLLLPLLHESIPELLVEKDLSSGRSEPEQDDKHQTPYHVLFTPRTNHVLCNNSRLRHRWRALPMLGSQA